MKKIRHAILLTILTLAVLALCACSIVGVRTIRGSGDVVEESREVNGVRGVNLATIGDLAIEMGDTESFRIEAEDNLMEYFETEVRGGTLRIGTQNTVRVRPTKPVRYYLTVTDLDKVDISSSGNIEAPDLEAQDLSVTVSSSGNLQMGDLEADTLVVRITSSGDVTMGELNAETLEVDMSSSGNLDIAGGEVNSQDITISSSGNYTAEEMASDEADVRLTSSGLATIWARDYLKANLSSSGNLRYRGNPTVDARTSSSGEVVHIGE